MKKIAATLVVAGVAAVASAQTSILYLTDVVHGRIMAYQGGVQLWGQPMRGGANESPIAVLDNTIRTTGAFVPPSRGGQYDLHGNFSGVTYDTAWPEGGDHYDGTTDGSSNYVVNYSNIDGKVYATDTDWQNPDLLFTITDSVFNMGITYDSTNNSLWISNYSFFDNDGWITNYDLAGNVLSSFGGAGLINAGLALDHADSTLWLVGTDAAIQFDKNGNRLSGFFDQRLSFVHGGEFLIPAPGSLALLGLGGLLAARRRR